MKAQKGLGQLFLEGFARKGYHALPSFPLLADDPTLLLVNSSLAPFKKVMIQGSNLPSSALVQRCLRAQNSPQFLFVFHMLGILGVANQLVPATHDFISFLEETANFPRISLHCVIDPSDSDLLQALKREISADNLHAHHGNVGRYWTRWAFGKHTGLTGRGLTLVYENQGLDACGRSCGVNCPTPGCVRYFPLGNVILVENLATGHRYLDIGFGLEALEAALGGTNYFGLPFYSALIAEAQSTLGKQAEDFIKHWVGAMCLIQEGLKPGPKGAPYVLRKLIRNLLTKCSSAEDLDKAPQIFGALHSRLCQRAHSVPWVMGPTPFTDEVATLLTEAIRDYGMLLQKNAEKAFLMLQKKGHAPLEELAKLLRESFGLPDEIIDTALELHYSRKQ